MIQFHYNLYSADQTDREPESHEDQSRQVRAGCPDRGVEKYPGNP